MTDKQKDFLVKDYELKVNYLSNHFTRMWTRFNIFLTLESGLIGGKVIFGYGTLGLPIATVLLGISVIWYIVGAQDRHLVTLYRGHVETALTKISTELLENDFKEYVGKPDKEKVINSMLDWYIPGISITRFAALLPLLLNVLWIVAIIYYYYFPTPVNLPAS